ncbi:DUF4202 domain-containing protein [Algoriphagus zhangzhouensis]|uniref:DUF4202 domain-containing protein n=1 Tax=Algoriphagus zhangzhouensis TaxID=1073327 RepID=A0A1M7ZA73_9BACT|nr:DUF4202 domain-containing protein [Algoriphagus zhangzhouensis]TDY47214.1 uncharacterized protein DUF4202 [Algoriphagus zhangzhouensis]SHO61825.1 protein of unknown function [Algoriphagus zhangzhouensis]
MNLFEEAISKIDQINAEDPNQEFADEKSFPKELLYSLRMSEKLDSFSPEAPDHLKIAARAQHIGRWRIPRSDYPMDRVGYLKWREELKKMHATLTSDILKDVGYQDDFIGKVSHLIRKRQLKTDEETQALEDVICLVFLEYYFDDFASKHEKDKIIDILQKTWAKMSEKGKDAALNLKLSPQSTQLIQEALSN